jgi:hypothetical protein
MHYAFQSRYDALTSPERNTPLSGIDCHPHIRRPLNRRIQPHKGY